MKTFLNVLYRRILYKIPLKFLLLLLGIGAIFFASCNAGFDNGTELEILDVSSQVQTYSNSNYDLLCITNVNCIVDQIMLGFVQGTDAWTIQGVAGGSEHGEVCTFRNEILYLTQYNSTCNLKVIGYNYTYTQNQCELEYNLIPISAIDSNYCETNNLCPVYTGECENSSGVNWSSLFINDIQHIGGPSIYIGIPEEIGRDYNYINDNMYITVSGYNVDYDKITGIIDIQNYKPSQEDFNNIIGILADYMPIIVIFLGLLFIYKMIRKPFKSKL